VCSPCSALPEGFCCQLQLTGMRLHCGPLVVVVWLWHQARGKEESMNSSESFNGSATCWQYCKATTEWLAVAQHWLHCLL